MGHDHREWLVRTRAGEILGPYSQAQLMEEIKERTFTPEDEIAHSLGHWISASTLTHHEADEFTLTSTRSQTFTRPTGAVASAAAVQEEELTPTPEFRRDPQARAVADISPPGPVSTPVSARRFPWPLVIPLLVVVTGVAIYLGRPDPKPFPEVSQIAPPLMPVVEESQFIKAIYSQIRAGQGRAALKILTRYHERGPAKGDKEYIIPYAALLISERESLGRARKMLEELIAENPKPSLKARAHLWLGYLLLSQDEEDMGEKHFLNSLEIRPGDPVVLFNLGRSYLKQEKFEKALEQLIAAENRPGEEWLVQIYKGRTLVSLGQSKAAELAFKRAIRSSPDRWISYVYQALFQTGASDRDGAQATLKTMLTRDPHFEVQSPPPLGYFQERVNYAEYLNAFNHVMGNSPPSEETELGRLYISYLATGVQGPEGRKLESLGASRTALPWKVLALKTLLDRNASQDELKAGLSRLPQNLAPFSYYAYVLRGSARIRMGQLNEAHQDVNKALGIDPSAAAAKLAMVEVLSASKKNKEAQSELNNLLDTHPQYIPAITFPIYNQ